MKIYKEMSFSEFEPWSGAVEVHDKLCEHLDCEELEDLENFIEFEVFYGEWYSDTQLNDFLWFESDTIAQHFGYDDWEAFVKAKEGGNDEDDEDYFDEEDED